MELFFPMAYNDEQVSIVQKLHANDGVVVQGPPERARPTRLPTSSATTWLRASACW
jgi:hypothetical protein